MSTPGTAHLFELWSRAAHREVVPAQLGYLEGGRRRRGRPRLPLLQLLVEPGGSLDLADPVTGFSGVARPPAERVLTLWADDLLSVRHGTDWIYVVDSTRPFASAWLDLLARPAGPLSRPRPAVVTASYGGVTPAGRFRVADLDATTYTTSAHVEDLRDHRGRTSGRYHRGRLSEPNRRPVPE